MTFVLVRIIRNKLGKISRIITGTHQYTEDQLESLCLFVSATDIKNVELCIALEVIS